MRKYFLRVCLLSTAFSILFVLSAFASSMGGGTVTASKLNIRNAADASASVLTVAPRGSTAIITTQSNGWYGVYYNGYAGYVPADYVDYTGELEGQFGVGIVNGSGVRIRSGPSLTSNVLTYCNTGAKFTVTGIDGPWYRIVFDETEGYIHSNYLTMTAPAVSAMASATDAAIADSTEDNNTGTDQEVSVGTAVEAVAASDYTSCSSGEYSTSGERIVETALQYLGVPYVWGGTSPSGFDCSGLVYYVYQQNGYAVNRTAETLYSNGTYVDRANLQIGDVLCFYSAPGGPYIGHTGIYIGNGKMIHASSSQNAIAVADLSTEYFNTRYCGARRIIA
jgi:cell wall-associated NlpC family hydrolase